MYKIFFTDVPLAAGQSAADYDCLMPLEYDTAEEAAQRAVLFVRKGYTVWKVEGPNGFFVNREALETVIAAADQKSGIRHQP